MIAEAARRIHHPFLLHKRTKSFNRGNEEKTVHNGQEKEGPISSTET